jgi:1-acyl-sn-glycerol-3-phosphate acyltransferase
MATILRFLFFALIVRPFILIVIGLRVVGRDKLPVHGPAIIAANHNSHLDTLVLLSLFPLRRLAIVRPAAAADYFLRSGPMAGFSKTLIGIIPVDRHGLQRREDPFVHVKKALAENQIVIVFPEGTRGEPEEMAELKKGIAHLIEQHPNVPVTPVHLRGLGKSLPKGSWLPVPFFCDVFVGDSLEWTGDRDTFMEKLRNSVSELGEEGHTATWE